MINRFYKYKVDLAFEKYQDIPATLPAITICSQNSFNEQYTFTYIKEKFNFDKDNGYHDEYIYDYELNQFEFISELFSHKILPSINQIKRTLYNDLNQTELSSMGYDLDSAMLISCQYNGHSCSEINGDFKRFWNNFYGNCYTFNGGNNSYLTGDQNGLHLEMMVSK
jgi:hypothetical protein